MAMAVGCAARVRVVPGALIIPAQNERLTSADATLTDGELEDVLVLLIAGVTHRLKPKSTEGMTMQQRNGR